MEVDASCLAGLEHRRGRGAFELVVVGSHVYEQLELARRGGVVDLDGVLGANVQRVEGELHAARRKRHDALCVLLERLDPEVAQRVGQGGVRPRVVGNRSHRLRESDGLAAVGLVGEEERRRPIVAVVGHLHDNLGVRARFLRHRGHAPDLSVAHPFGVDEGASLEAAFADQAESVEQDISRVEHTGAVEYDGGAHPTLRRRQLCRNRLGEEEELQRVASRARHGVVGAHEWIARQNHSHRLVGSSLLPLGQGARECVADLLCRGHRGHPHAKRRVACSDVPRERLGHKFAFVRVRAARLGGGNSHRQRRADAHRDRQQLRAVVGRRGGRELQDGHSARSRGHVPASE